MQNNLLKILAVGDVVGPPGVEYAVNTLRRAKLEQRADVVIVNAENSSHTNGLDAKSAQALFEAGADILTGGNHTLKRRDIADYLNDHPCALRPANYQPSCPGNGYAVLQVKNGCNLLVINVAGQVFMDSADSPFYAVERIIKSVKYDACVVDFHAEATSEKAALAKYFDGRINCVYGTHTHVQTADETLLPRGGAFISDLGMCGACDSILGMKNESVINRFLNREFSPFEAPDGERMMCGAVITINLSTGYTADIKRIKY